ncbi:MAG TPA: amino acid adenylation domain-containing protein [Myxococcus sp.]|nr:amino acid adenylation domain-containing protein [Myxococcus sp.]
MSSPTPLPAGTAASGARHMPEERVYLSPEDTAALQSFARRHQLTLNTLLQAAWALLLARHSGLDDVLFGITVAGRPPELPGADNMVGLFINSLPARVRLPAHEPLLSWLQSLQAQQQELQSHEHSPLVQVQGWSEVPRGTPLFDSLLVFENYPLDASVQQRADTLLDIREVSTFDHTHYPLTLGVIPGQRLLMRLSYDSARYDEAGIQRLLGQLRSALQSMVAGAGQRLADVTLLSEPERRQLLVEWNGARTEGTGDSCAHALFEAQARRTPDAPAVTFEGTTLTYAELDRRANQLAWHLRARGVGPEVLVGLCVERSPELVVGMLGIMKAGGAYVPLDPSLPMERLGFMIAQAGLMVLVTQEPLADQLPASGQLLVCLDSDAPALAAEPATPPATAATADTLAYAIFTSGSTGQPKGTLLVHRGLCNTALAAMAALDIQPHGRVLQFASTGFDASVWEVFSALLAGACLVLAPREQLMPGEPLQQLLVRESISTVTLTPSALAPLSPQGLPALRTVAAAGEACTPELATRWKPGRRFINAYGPTEVTVCATLSADVDVERPTIGAPLPNVQVYVLGTGLELLLPGASGELYVGGLGLARGYLRQPALTAERFVPHPFSTTPGERLYRTGDRVRWRADGTLEFLGRADHQVKVRGFRIELGEIEAVLSRYPTVREAAVVVREDVPGDKRLVAYVSGRTEGPDVAALRAFLKERLPEYMVPSAFVVLDTLPVSSSGKVDRKALPAPEHERVESVAFVAPTNAIEEPLASTWSRLLNVARVGIHDDFFELGGHSLLATQLASRVRELFRVDLSLRDLFNAPTVAGMAARIQALLQQDAGLAVPALTPRARSGALPLSFAQQRLWFLEQLERGSPLYNIPLAVRLEGTLEVEVLQRCFTEIIRRHESLRTSFREGPSGPEQLIAPPMELPLVLVDLQSLPEEAREAEARRCAHEEAQRPFELSRAPLVRMQLLRLRQQTHVLLLTMHHIVSDGWSMSIFVREIAALYEAFSQGRPSPLPELPLQYADYATWQRGWLRDEALETQLSWWRDHLKGAPPLLELPTDRPRPAIRSFRGALATAHLPQALSSAIETLAHQAGATPFMVLLAAFKTLLHRYSGQEDLTVGTDIANRNHGGTEGLIGFFINQLALRTRLSGQRTFLELLALERETLLGAYAHQDLPFEELVKALNPERSLGHSPLFQLKLVFQNAPVSELALPGLALSYTGSDTHTARFDLTLAVTHRPTGMELLCEYSTDLFDAGTMERMLGHLGNLLHAATEAPDRPLSALPLLAEAERHQLLTDWNDTAAPLPDVPLAHALIEAHARQAPDAPAVVLGDTALTYAELDARANQLAWHLRALGVGPETPVALCLERTPELVVAVLAILKAGGAYVPMDPSYPAERLAFLLQDCGAPLLLTVEAVADELPVTGQQLVCIDTDAPLISGQPLHAPPARTAPEALAYVIYTSGSTGQPKGTLLTHRGLCNTALAAVRAHGFQPHSRVLQFASIGFDASVAEIFATLAAGACLVLAPREELLPGLSLHRLLAAQRVSAVTLTPSVLAQLEPAGLPSLQTVISVGEALPPAVAARWAPHVRLLNAYGPTEVTICASISGAVDPERPTIGRPFPNVSLYVLDAHLRPVPVGVPGELFIGGPGLARGYLHQPALTAERFIPHPFSPEPGARLYRSGDRVRYLPDGQLEFLGRVDSQLKLRGFRIEPGEVEARLRQQPSVRDAFVTVREDAPGDRRLVAYVVAQDGAAPPEPTSLRAALTERLPDYLVPSAFVVLDTLPLTPSGKVDRAALPVPGASRAAAAFVPPRNATEQQLAAIWAELLNVESVGIHDDFFELGGHSLLATQALSRVRTAFGVELPLKDVFSSPTVAHVSSLILMSQASSTAPEELDQMLTELESMSAEEIEALLAEEAAGPDKASSNRS